MGLAPYEDDSRDEKRFVSPVKGANMQFMPTEIAEQQIGLTLHRARYLFIRQQTAFQFNRAYLSEFGFVAPVSCLSVEQLIWK
ncbi:hypothetical protein NLM27_27335 [Bradyrhizobium sp. CCGB12]|uniref:hypothetical protein n=1 Tax=Bradyrhizobium sp. CCGB12 TaxID=2949632 RepID=UPI0020B215BD|nr:hypothetical protein [Bradyrhizobium sp. CCGB12]MCP3392464.1 hypothetical protein [Bradyrhizobium sp. CCGB12]